VNIQYSKDPGEFEMEIHSTKETYRVGHALWLRIDFINRDDFPFIFGRPEMRRILNVSMTDDSGNQLPVKSYKDRMNGGGPMNEIKPGEKYSDVIDLLNYVEITNPGTYEVTVETKGDYYSRMRINKRKITIKIEEKRENK
jgi:hypothetical protein